MLELSQNPKVQRVLLVFFLIVYLVSVGGNLLIMITIVFSPTLGSPMYFFLSCLSFIDTCYSSCMTPKLVADSLYEGRAITFEGCLAQFFVAHLLGGTEIINKVFFFSRSFFFKKEQGLGLPKFHRNRIDLEVMKNEKNLEQPP